MAKRTQPGLYPTVQIRDRIKELRRVPASELRPNPRNWRRHPPAQEAALRGVLEEVGFADAVIARDTADGLELIDGHLRQEVMGDQPVPVLIVDMSEEEAGKMILTLDPLAAMAGRDEERLTELLSTVSSDNDTVNALLQTLANGYEPLTLLEPEPPDEGFDADGAMDDVEADDYEPTVQRGEVWSLGQHRLMCGDATSEGNVVALMDGAFTDFVISSPPYNVGMDYAGTSDRLDNADYWVMVDKTLANAYMAMAEGRAIMWNVGVSPKTRAHDHINAIERAGFKFNRQIIWAKIGAAIPIHHHFEDVPLARRWMPNYKHEVIWMASKGDLIPGDAVIPDRSIQHDVWDIGRFNASKDSDEHPAPYPRELIEKPLSVMTSKSESVYDPFVGSGTTIIAAERLGRRCYAMEIEPRYCDVAIKRWEDYTGEQAVKV